MAQHKPGPVSVPMEESHLDEEGGLISDGEYSGTGESSGDDDDLQRLLPSENVGAEKPVTHLTRSRRRQWILPTLIAVSSIVIFALSWILLPSICPANKQADSVQGAEHDVPSRRPGEDYILDSGWDFGAPNQVRSHNWTIVDKDGNPDGVFKPMMMINGQFPGPLIEVNEGDVIVVDVLNQAVNATALHWHGIFQNRTNWMDGAAGVTQCPITPGGSFRYKFNVTGQSGTYFYHGHQGVQALDGLVGPLVVHSRGEADAQPIPYSSDRVILLQDWYYDAAIGLMRDVLSPGVEDAPIPNTALINGLNQARCSDHPSRKCSTPQETSPPSLGLTHGGSHRLRFLNVGGYAWFQVGVDEHASLPVIEVDGTTVEPAPASALLISPGQRYSVVLTSDRSDKEAFWLRARMVTACFAEQKLPENGIEEAKVVVRYTHADNEARHENDDDGTILLPDTTSNLEFISICKDMSSTTTFTPSPPQPAPGSADHSWYLRVNLAIGDWRLQRGVLNSSSFRPNLKSPTLHRVLDGLAQNNETFIREGVNAAAFDPVSELVISHNAVETVDVVLQNMDENSHPFHLHGTQMWVLGAGHGYFPGYEALGLQPEGKGLLDPANSSIINNPLKRDTVTVEGFGWALLRFVADNPGVWLFHCHMIWHSEAGMGMQFVSRLDAMRGWTLPDEARELCDATEDELRKGAPPGDEVIFGFGDDEG